MIQFYAPQIATSPFLPEEEAIHCVKALRKNVGNKIYVTDGMSSRYLCEIIAIDAKKNLVELRIEEKFDVPCHWGAYITLAIAPTKNSDRMEWLVEKSVELGINRLAFIKCQHSERKEIKLQRLQKIAISAMKQSLKTTLPIIESGMNFGDFIASAPNGDISLYIAHCEKDKPRQLLATSLMCNSEASGYTLLIGPEGDFSEEEIKLALERGYEPVSLGESRLRTETAALFALASIHTILQCKQ